MGRTATSRLVKAKAKPMADPDLATEVYDLVEKATNNKQVKKGAKECVRSLKWGISRMVVMAADTRPIDVLDHIPVMCREKNVPWVFVKRYVRVRMYIHTL